MRPSRIPIAPFLGFFAACGGTTPTPATSPDRAPTEDGGVQASPPVPCAVLAESGEGSHLYGQPPDNARANDLSLEELPTRAADLDGQLVRTHGTIEVVGRDGKWLVVHDPLFDGWVFVAVRGREITVPAGAMGCQAKLEGTLERVRLGEAEKERMLRDGRPEESFLEEGPDPQVVLLGLLVTQPAGR